MSARLFIDNKECELSKEEIIALSYGVNRLTDIESRQGFFSNTFKLPLTEKNREIFGFADELNATNTKRWERLTACIEVDGAVVVTGSAKLQSTGETLSVVVQGGNSDWILDIRGKLLSDLDLSAFNHSSEAVIANRFNDFTDGFVYPDVDYGLLEAIAASTAIDKYNFKPAIFARLLVDKIFSEAGWTLTNELDDVTLFNEMVLPFSNEKPVHSDDWITATSFRAHISTHTEIANAALQAQYAGIDDISTGVYFDNANQMILSPWTSTIFPAPEIFTPAYEANQFFQATISFTIPVWFVGATFEIFFADLGVLSESVTYAHTDALGSGTFSATIISYKSPATVQDIVVRFRQTGFTINGGDFFNEVEPFFYNGTEWAVSVNLPEMNQTDFIKYIINVFSMLIIPNVVSKTIRILPFDQVPINVPEDWSDKVDLIDLPEISTRYGNYAIDNVLSYDIDDGDRFLSDLKTLGEYSIVNNNGADNRKNLYKAPFSLCARIYTLTESVNKAAIHTFTDSEDNTRSSKPRIAAHRVVLNSTQVIDLIGETPQTSASELYHIDIEWETLVTAYWQTLEAIIQNPQMVLQLIRLSSSDINQLDFTTPKWIDKYGCLFYLSFVDQYKVNLVDSTVCELIKLP